MLSSAVLLLAEHQHSPLGTSCFGCYSMELREVHSPQVVMVSLMLYTLYCGREQLLQTSWA